MKKYFLCNIILLHHDDYFFPFVIVLLKAAPSTSEVGQDLKASQHFKLWNNTVRIETHPQNYKETNFSLFNKYQYKKTRTINKYESAVHFASCSAKSTNAVLTLCSPSHKNK